MSGLTPGDPLGGEPAPRPREPASDPLWSARDAAPASLPGIPGYTGQVPPGAGGPAPIARAGAGPYTLASWGRRVGAQLIDGVIVGIGAVILLVLITAPFSIGFFANNTVGFVSIVVGVLLAVLSIAVVSLLYAPAMMARTNGRTIGRSALGIRVVRADGQAMTFGFAMLREVAVKALLFGVAGTLTAGIANLLDVLWPLWDEENRALHDFVVNTRTVVD
jgi:uncharacterized RDD family membrane protein YckC